MDKTTIEPGNESFEMTEEAGILTFGIACCLGAIAVVLVVAARNDVSAESSRPRRPRRAEHQRDAVDAVPLAGGRRPVVEDVAEMPAAAAAMLLDARHEQGIVLVVADGAVDLLPRSSASRCRNRTSSPRRRPPGRSRRSGTCPSRCSSSSGLVPGRSVASSRSTANCSGVRIARHSSSVLVTSKTSSAEALGTGACRTGPRPPRPRRWTRWRPGTGAW